MPYINTTTTKKITDAERAELIKTFGKLIEIIPGKIEAYLMLNFEDGKKMAYQGDAEQDCAILAVDILGAAEEKYLKALSDELCLAVNRVIGVPTDRIYVKFGVYDNWYCGVGK